MKISNIRKVNGLCYVENILDEYGRKVSRVLFDNECRLIDEANAYLRELRITKLSSYNSVKIISYDLCYFYDFLIATKLTVKDMNNDNLNEFIDYLLRVKKEKRDYAIEKTMLRELNINKENPKVHKIRKFGELDDKSIERIFGRAIDYLKEISKKNVEIKLDMDTFGDRKGMSGFLKSSGITIYEKQTDEIDEDKLFTKDQLSLIINNASRKNDYMCFILFILENCGMRVGETLGLNISVYNPTDIKLLKGDINYKEGKWQIKVYWKYDNPVDSLSKSRSSRTITIPEKESYEFESLLERYLRYRSRIVNSKNKEWLFINNRGSKLTYDALYKRFKRILNEVCPESNSTLHYYRHTKATNMLLDGVPLEIVAMILGHESPLTTYRIYVHYRGESMKKVRGKYKLYTEKLLKLEESRRGSYK